MIETLELILAFMVFISGTMFGSFFTLATYRIPRKQDIVKTRSYCPNCKHKLGFFDCFPILSYVSTIGRCRYCKKPISIRYPLMEFASGMVFLLIYLFFGLSVKSLILVACYVYLFLTIGVDIMRSKMTDEEKKEVEEISKKKLNKAGGVNVDIVVALAIFVIFFVSTIYLTRNYTLTIAEYTRKSNALNLCLNKINEAKATSFDDLESIQGTAKIDNVDYMYNVDVSNFVKGEEVNSYAKVVNTTVTYIVNGVENNVSLRCIKVE